MKKRVSYCLVCRRRMGGNDLCKEHGGPTKVADRTMRRAIRALAPLDPVVLSQRTKRNKHLR